MKHKLFIVTGAPGAGKSTALQAFIKLRSSYIAFDIDWLAESASDLAGKSIYFESSIWKPYFVLWSDVLLSVYKNGQTPILFAPYDKKDLDEYGLPDWCSAVEWILLDCDDETRRSRLSDRKNWSDKQTTEALRDATYLRNTIKDKIDTDSINSEEVARQLIQWLMNQV